jgi:hypothetical protein
MLWATRIGLLETVSVGSENTYASTQSTCSAVRVARRACSFFRKLRVLASPLLGDRLRKPSAEGKEGIKKL